MTGNTIDGEVRRSVWLIAVKARNIKADMNEITDELMATIAQEANKATTGIVKALTNKGSHPAYHDEQMRYLETHWPTLYFELRKLITADKEQADE